MAILDFVMIFLATGALVNAWMLTGGLFEGWRDFLAAWGEPEGVSPRSDAVRQFFAKLLTCRICLTYHVSFWLLVLFYLPSSLWLSPPWAVVWLLPVYALAATRLSLLVGMLVALFDLKPDPEND